MVIEVMFESKKMNFIQKIKWTWNFWKGNDMKIKVRKNE